MVAIVVDAFARVLFAVGESSLMLSSLSVRSLS
jgi:hypothetical protein